MTIFYKSKKMKKNIQILFAIIFFGVLIKLVNKAVEETAEVIQYAPHIMEPPMIDLSDTMIFHTKDTFKTKEK